MKSSNLRTSLLALGIVALLTMNLTPVSGDIVDESTSGPVVAEATSFVSALAGPLDDEPLPIQVEEAVQWVYAYAIDGQEIRVLNPLKIQSLGANPELAKVEAQGDDAASGFPFDLTFDATSIATDGDQVELFVINGLTQDLQEGLGGNGDVNGQPSWLTIANPDLLAHYDEIVKSDYGDVVSFDDVPATVGAQYFIKVGSEYFPLQVSLIEEEVGSPASQPTNQQALWGGNASWAGNSTPQPTPPGIGAQRMSNHNVVFQDDFDDGTVDTSRWIASGVKESSNCGSVSSPYSLYFYGTSSRQAATRSMDVSGGGTIRFSLRHGTATGGGPCDTPDANTDDDFALEYSTNGGSTWTRISTYATPYYGSWSEQTVSIPSAAQSLTTQFRWRVLNFAADSNRDHWVIDNVEVTTNVAQSTIFEDNFNDGSFDGFKWSSYSGARESGNCGSKSSPYSLYFYGTSSRSATTLPMETSNGGNVGFWLRHGTATGGGPCDTPDPNTDDDFTLEYSTNGGSTWNRMATYAAGDHGTWEYQNVEIPSGARSSSTQFRWRALNFAADSNRDHWVIDDLSIATHGGMQVNCGRFPTAYEFSWQPGRYKRDWETDLNEDEPVNLAWGGWRYHYKYYAEQCETNSVYNIADKAAFGFGFHGENVVKNTRVLKFGGQIQGEICTNQNCPEGERPNGMQHLLKLDNMRFFYRQPADPGVSLEASGIHGRPSSTGGCSSTQKSFDEAARTALTIAGVVYPWLGLATLVPDSYCDDRTIWRPTTNDYGYAGRGAKTPGIESTEVEQQVAGYVNADYTNAIEGDLFVEFSASVEHYATMKGCRACWSAEDHGAYAYTVTPAMFVEE